jgi:hypothetical protein
MTHTDIGDNTGNDDLLLVGGFDGSPEGRVVPGVDLALALDERRLGVHVENLLWQGTVGA